MQLFLIDGEYYAEVDNPNVHLNGSCNQVHYVEFHIRYGLIDWTKSFRGKIVVFWNVLKKTHI